MLRGFHHVTAVSGDPRTTLDFYTGFFGLRLVKRTVNFDDPGTHHFYFSGGAGKPGTLLTFFPWPVARRAQPGIGQAVDVAFQTGSLRYWSERAADAGVACGPETVEFGERVLVLRDPFGLVIKLVERDEATPRALDRIHAVTILEADPAPLASVLTDLLGFKPAAQEGNRRCFELADSARIDIVEASTSERGKPAPGAIHHLALHVADEAEQDAWRARLIAAGIRVSIPQNRRYFRSIYFRSHRSVLFELATTGPGFAVDEPSDALGKSLCLPPWLESERAHIETRLAPIDLSVIR